LAGVARGDMIVLELEDMGADTSGFWMTVRNVNLRVNEKEAGVGNGVARIRREWDGKELLLSERIMLEAFEDVGMERLRVDKFDRSCNDGF